MPKNKRLFFLCTGQAVEAPWLSKHPGSHIIGELEWVFFEKTVVTGLAYYEVSLPVNSPPETRPPVIMQIIGDAMNIKCTCCKRHARWLIGKAAVNHVLKKYAPE